MVRTQGDDRYSAKNYLTRDRSTEAAKAVPRKLVLDCSLRFFSNGNQPDGTFQMNSLNNRFFSEGMPLTLESVFILLGQNDREVIGSPLFLKLSPDHQVAL
jgi:hypothetical protein